MPATETPRTVGAGDLRRQLECDLELRHLVGASEEHRRSNHSRQYGDEEDSDFRDLHHLDSGSRRARRGFTA